MVLHGASFRSGVVRGEIGIVGVAVTTPASHQMGGTKDFEWCYTAMVLVVQSFECHVTVGVPI